MAVGLTGSVKNTIIFTPTNTISGDTVGNRRQYTRTKSWSNGAGANAVNVYFEDVRTLADGASETLDLSGTLSALFGSTAVFARVKYVYIENLSTARTLTVGNATAPAQLWFGAAANTETIAPGGHLERDNPTATGWAVTNTTADGLKIANDAGSTCQYRIIIAGAAT